MGGGGVVVAGDGDAARLGDGREMLAVFRGKTAGTRLALADEVVHLGVGEALLALIIDLVGIHRHELALARGQGGEAYFITDGQAWTFRDLVGGMLAARGITPPDKTVPRWLLRTMANLGDVLTRLTDGRVTLPITMQALATSAVEVTLEISKAQRDLGYRPVISIKQGLEDMRVDAA